jgi:hypothetical protein
MNSLLVKKRVYSFRAPRHHLLHNLHHCPLQARKMQPQTPSLSEFLTIPGAFPEYVSTLYYFSFHIFLFLGLVPWFGDPAKSLRRGRKLREMQNVIVETVEYK